MKDIHILLVEDNPGDILLTTEAILEGKIVDRISVVNDGEEAILFLEDIITNSKKKFPDLILLDVNIPKKNGHEVLAHIKDHDHLKQIPVIMLTTSSSEKDIISSYKNRVNCFITKPVEVDDFIKAVSEIEKFWFKIVQLPNHKNL
jgi:CheY-like chemotaxis protein